MLRNPDIRSEISGYIDTLVELYNDTDPAKGEESEFAKLELARQAIEKFWYIFGRLMLWAQCQLTGYCIVKDNPEIVSRITEEFNADLTEDSHLLEVLGLLYIFNPVDREDKLLTKMEDLFESDSGVLDDHAMRELLKELLMSRCANSSYWRFPFQTALRSMNEGEVDPLLQVAKSRLRGKPATLNRWKLEALRQVHYRIGKGMKKHRALRELSDAIGQSPETLRDWEQLLLKKDDYQVDLYCSQLAGEFDTHFRDGNHSTSIPDYEEYGIHRGLWNLQNAYIIHRTVTTLGTQEIKDKIRQYRDPETSGV